MQYIFAGNHWLLRPHVRVIFPVNNHQLHTDSVYIHVPFNPSPLQSLTTVTLTKVIFHITVKPLYSCISLSQQQRLLSVGAATILYI